MKPFIYGGTSPNPSTIELENRALARKVASEGFVLLKNQGVLPLHPGKVALYGSGARKTVKGGTGSGAVRERYSVSIETGLENAGYEITTKSWLDRFDQFYTDTYNAYCQEQETKVTGIHDFFQILRTIDHFRYPTGIPVTKEDIDGSCCSTAIYVIARQAGEGRDRKNVPGDYQLDELERNNLTMVSRNYAHTIVIVNVGGMIDLSFLDEENISALVYFSQAGEEGGNAIADVLSGNVNFSGKLATSWPVDFADVPSALTYSTMGKDPFHQEYNEGIYIGYRYYDTFGIKPRFPFGFGLSYTTFSIAAKEVSIHKGYLTLSALATNTGSINGREVIQLYASVPFGSGAEKQRLVAFQKTTQLAPGESQEIELNVPAKMLACYDESQNAWILRQGCYILRLGNASDHTEPIAVLTLKKEAILEECTAACAPIQAIDELCPPCRGMEDLKDLPEYAIETMVPEPIVHTYETPEEEIDTRVSNMTAEELVKLVLGSDAFETPVQISALGSSGNTSQMLYESLGVPNAVISDGPAGLNLTPQVVQLPNGTVKAVYNDENLEAYRKYMFGINKIALRQKMGMPEDGIVHYQYCTAWPCSQLLAQTFDPAITEAVGYAAGREMEAYGVTVWLTPGMNIHRNPLCGRTFEYYSEDPLVSGKMAAGIVRGVQAHPGKGTSIKHFAANNCELQRNYSSSNLSQRALREIYLRGFEIALQESDPLTVMAAYNKINDVYCTNNHDLLVKILRNEWGYKGLVMSDWHAMKCAPKSPCTPQSGDVQKAHAAQCDLIMPGRPDQYQALLTGLENGTVNLSDLQRSAVRILRLLDYTKISKFQERWDCHERIRKSSSDL